MVPKQERHEQYDLRLLSEREYANAHEPYPDHVTVLTKMNAVSQCKNPFVIQYFTLMLCCIFCLFVAISGKTSDEDDVAPQSKYVEVYGSGLCGWSPRYDHSVSQCPVDVTWFPFDEQKCDLVFQSWNLRTNELELHLDERDYLQSFRDANEWHAIGACRRHYRSMLHSS